MWRIAEGRRLSCQRATSRRALPIMRMNIAVAAVIVRLAAFMVRAGGLFSGGS